MEQKETLITTTDQNDIINGQQESFQSNRNQNCQTKLSRNKLIIVFGVLLLVGFVIMWGIMNYGPSTYGIRPQKIAIPWYQNKSVLMELGTSRIFQVLYFSGQDNRTNANFLLVTERAVNWTVQPQGIVSVDMYGRIQALKIGSCVLKVESIISPEVWDFRTIQVIKQRQDVDVVPKRVIKFTGTPSPHVSNLQKLIHRFTKQQVKTSSQIPESVKYASANPQLDHKKTFLENSIKWQIIRYADKSPNSTYVLRTNTTMNENNKDKYQYFIGDRYLPDTGRQAIMIDTDLNQGMWVVGPSGCVNHIIMKKMSYIEKAEIMRNQTAQFVQRYGIVGNSAFIDNKWVPGISDNDGLWTSMFGAGQLMRYDVIKNNNASSQQITKARASALKSLKAVLMISNVAGRDGIIDAKIRHLVNTKVGRGAFYQPQYLKKAKQLEVQVYPGKPSDAIDLFGIDAGKTIGNDSYPGQPKFSFRPIHAEDWTIIQDPAISKRNLKHFIARSFYVSKLEKKQTSGTWFQRNTDGSQTVIVGADTLYQYTSQQTPNLHIGDLEIPQILMDIVYVNGTQYNKTDLVYKGDTSTDEIVGHLFIYKIAFDILDQNDKEQNQLRELIKSTMRGFCQHLINNGYTMVDATGQATKWAKLTRQQFTNDYDIEDSPLKAIQLVLSFKLAYYVTGQKKWKQEYDLLVDENGPFDYLNLIASLWEMWKYAYTQIDDTSSGIHKVNQNNNASELQIQRHCLYQTHFSDEQQAYLAYYVAFQLEEDPDHIKKYRKGLEGYWHSISHSQNPLWYYIFQLASPSEAKNDAFKQNINNVASWQLSRHMIDTTKYQAFILGSRPDVIFQQQISVNPQKVLQNNRTIVSDILMVNSSINHAISPTYSPNKTYEIKVLPADERLIHKFNGATFYHIDTDHSPNNMEGCTTYTLPLWLGMYHNMLSFE